MKKRNRQTAAGEPTAEERQYLFEGREPIPWRITAAELKRAADLLADQWLRDLDEVTARAPGWGTRPTVAGAFMVLAAFAIENIAKAILIGRDPTLFPLVLERDGGIRTHNLVHLLERIGPGWSVDELTLARRLSAFAIWAGRYPTPMKPTEKAGWRAPDQELMRPDGTKEILEGSFELPGIIDRWDPGRVDRLFRRLADLFESEHSVRGG